MSIIRSIKNFALELLGINDSQSTLAQIEEQKNTPIIECKNVDKPIDKIEISNKEKNGNVIYHDEQSLKSLKSLIENKCQKYNIDYKKIIKSPLMQTNNKDALKVLDYVIEKLLKNRDNVDVLKEASMEELIIASSEVAYEALKQGVFKTVQEYDNAKKRPQSVLGKNFKNLNRLERRERLLAHKNELKQRLHNDLLVLNNLPTEERELAAQKLKEKYRFIQKGFYNDILAECTSEVSADALVILDSESLIYGLETLFKTRRSKDVRTRTADYIDYGFTKNLISDYKEYGDEISANSLKTYSSTLVGNKSEKAVTEYKNAYIEDRCKYENALEKIKNGKSLSAEEEYLVSVMKTEYYTATAQGIVSGIVDNSNLTEDSKVNMIVNFNQESKRFSDYAEIQATIQENIDKNESLKNKIETLEQEIQHKKTVIQPEKNKTKVKDKVNNITDRNVKDSSSSSEEIISVNSITFDTLNNVKKQEAQNLIPRPKINQKKIIKNCTNPYLIEQELNSSTNIKEAFSKFDKIDVIKVVLSDTKKFKEFLPIVMSELESAGKTTLIGIVATSSDSVVTTLCKELGKEKIEPLLNRKLCYTARKEIENMG